MSWDFKPGMKVVCVNANDCMPTYGAPVQIVKGQIYEIDRVVRQWGFNPEGRLGFGFCLVLKGVPGVRRNGLSWSSGYAVSRFRPVRTTNIDALKAHLAPKPILAEV